MKKPPLRGKTFVCFAYVWKRRKSTIAVNGIQAKVARAAYLTAREYGGGPQLGNGWEDRAIIGNVYSGRLPEACAISLGRTRSAISLPDSISAERNSKVFFRFSQNCGVVPK